MSLENILSALDYTPPTMGRDDWVKILMAVKSELGDDGRDIAENWSQGGDFNQSDFNSTWTSINGTGAIGIGTLFHYAKQSGWQKPQPSTLGDQVTQEKKQTAAQIAESRWNGANDADPDHAYLMNKKIDPVGIRQEGSNLLIPIQDKDGNLTSLQTITPDGKKLFQKGSTTKGGYMRLDGNTASIVLCEGYATGVTIQGATGARVAVAFSCHNLMPVAKIIREKLPDADIVIAADSKPVSTLEKAREVAKTIGARLAVPTVDSDFNDMMVAGQDVRSVIESSVKPVPDGFYFQSLSEVRKNLKGAQFLVKPFLERETVTVMFGESGAYKSFICLDMGLCIAFGIPYHGHPTNKGAVFYVCGEGAGGIGRRVESWLIDHRLTNSDAPFFISSIPGRLIEEGNAIEIANIIEKQSDNPALIIIDTLSTNIGDGDESSNTDIGALMDNVGRHIKLRFGACVLIVHHVGHGEKDRERGAYALRGNSDARILIKAEAGYSCSMHSLKMKDGTDFQPVLFHTKVVGIPGANDSEGEAVSSLVLEIADYVEDETATLSAQHQQALALLEDMYAERVENISIQGRHISEAKVETKE